MFRSVPTFLQSAISFRASLYTPILTHNRTILCPATACSNPYLFSKYRLLTHSYIRPSTHTHTPISTPITLIPFEILRPQSTPSSIIPSHILNVFLSNIYPPTISLLTPPICTNNITTRKRHISPPPFNPPIAPHQPRHHPPKLTCQEKKKHQQTYIQPRCDN